MNVTAYFIDDSWNYWKVFLIFWFLHDQHISQSIIVKLYIILNKYNLTHQLLTITTDNCSNNESMWRVLSEHFESKNYAWNVVINIIFCFAHIIQLTVKDLLDFLKISVVNESIILLFNKNNLQQITQKISLFNTLLKIYCHVLFNRYF